MEWKSMEIVNGARKQQNFWRADKAVAMEMLMQFNVYLSVTFGLI